MVRSPESERRKSAPLETVEPRDAPTRTEAHPRIEESEPRRLELCGTTDIEECGPAVWTLRVGVPPRPLLPALSFAVPC